MKIRIQLNLSIEDAEALRGLVKDYGHNYYHKGNTLDGELLEIRLRKLIEQQYKKVNNEMANRDRIRQH